MPDKPTEDRGDGPREIFVLVNNGKVGPFHSGEVTGGEIKRRGGFALTTELFRITDHGLVPVRNDEKIHIHEGEKFECIPPSPAS